MPDTPKELLRKALKQHFGSDNLADAIRHFNWQKHESAVRHHFNGTRTPGKEWAARYAKAFGISRTRLLQLDVDESTTSVPVVGKAALGQWYDIELEEKTNPAISARSAHVPRSLGREMRRAVEVTDSSVNLAIKPGDLAIIEPISKEQLAEIDDGYLYVSRKRDGLEERTIRKVGMRRSGKLELTTHSSDNRFISTITYPSSRAGETVEILGRVVAQYGHL